jgi:hypothetical protein
VLVGRNNRISVTTVPTTNSQVRQRGGGGGGGRWGRSGGGGPGLAELDGCCDWRQVLTDKRYAVGGPTGRAPRPNLHANLTEGGT